MTDWIDVANVDDLPVGQCAVVDVDDVMVAVFNVDGEYYAIEDVCTHDGAEIATGKIDGACIECPRHGAKFDIKTGAVLSAPAYESITTFPVRVMNQQIQVRDDRWD